MTLRLITPPAAEPATVAEVKLDAHMNGTTFDATITTLITAARRRAEDITGRSLITQTWELVLDYFPAGPIKIGMLPIQSVTSITYYDTNAALQTLAADQYALDANTLPGWINPAYGVTWPITRDVPNAVIIRFVTGYGLTAATVPEEIRMWIRAQAAAVIQAQSDQIDKSPTMEFTNGLLDGYKLYHI
jgi:uncharacterized phiE125 gp8 family phage protein